MRHCQATKCADWRDTRDASAPTGCIRIPDRVPQRNQRGDSRSSHLIGEVAVDIHPRPSVAEWIEDFGPDVAHVLESDDWHVRVARLESAPHASNLQSVRSLLANCTSIPRYYAIVDAFYETKFENFERFEPLGCNDAPRVGLTMLLHTPLWTRPDGATVFNSVADFVAFCRFMAREVQLLRKVRLSVAALDHTCHVVEGWMETMDDV